MKFYTLFTAFVASVIALPADTASGSPTVNVPNDLIYAHEINEHFKEYEGLFNDGMSYDDIVGVTTNILANLTAEYSTTNIYNKIEDQGYRAKMKNYYARSQIIRVRYHALVALGYANVTGFETVTEQIRKREEAVEKVDEEFKKYRDFLKELFKEETEGLTPEQIIEPQKFPDNIDELTIAESEGRANTDNENDTEDANKDNEDNEDNEDANDDDLDIEDEDYNEDDAEDDMDNEDEVHNEDEDIFN